MLNDFLQSSNLIKDEPFHDQSNISDFSKDFVDKFVDNFINVDKQHPHLKYECKILPYEESKSGKELFKCPLCQVDRIEGRKHLTDHLHQHQLQYRPCEGKHLCCLCGKELSSNSSLERHLLTHSNHRPFDCQLCGKKFTTNGNLSRHIKASHGPNFTPISAPNDICFSKSSFDTTTNTQTFSLPVTPQKGSSSMSNMNSPVLTSPPLSFNIFSLPSLGIPLNANNILVKFIEDSLKAYHNISEPFSYREGEILNLSNKSEPLLTVKQEILSPLSESNDCLQSSKPSTTSKRIAKKISQKYRDQRATSKQRFVPKPKESADVPLDLSINKHPSPKSELNSFLSSSSDNFLSPVKSESYSEYDEISKFKLKKNSYKDAPKLIRCPMNGCTQKFPWNSSLMRHILTHTAHKPFQCIRCSKCFSTKSNRERHMHRVHGIKVNRSRIKCAVSPDHSLSGSINEHIFQEFTNSSLSTEFLSEQEWIQMSSSDRKAEDISHSLLKQAGDPVIEPNPHRQLFQMKTLLTI